MTSSSGGKTIADWRESASIASRGRLLTSLINLKRRHYLANSARFLAASIAAAATCILFFTARVSAESMLDPERETRGILRAEHKATFATDLNAPVAKVPFRDGDSFKKGDTLIAFDCRRQTAQLASMQAQHREMDVQLEGNVYLQKRGAVGKRDLEVSRARADRANHDARALEVRLERCVIKAPFDGRIRTLAINKHETPASGKPILEIVGTDKIELNLIVPSVWLVWLTEGTEFTFKVDETSREYNAHVRRIGAAVDPVSQTISLTGKLMTPAPELRPGMSGTAIFPKQNSLSNYATFPTGGR